MKLPDGIIAKVDNMWNHQIGWQTHSEDYK